MSASRIRELRLRAILDSRGERTVEAVVALAGGAEGTGSCPVAIAPGRRERRRAAVGALGARDAGAAGRRARRALEGATVASQDELDAHLRSLGGRAANVTLAVSIAFCRARAAEAGLPLHRHLARLAATTAAMPHLLVNVFSGGVHGDRPARSFQQVMLAPELASVAEEIEAGLAVFAAAEDAVARRGLDHRLSASSGIVRRDASPERLLGELREHAERLGLPAQAAQLGVDVAAEHLAIPGGGYRLGSDELGGERLLDRLEAMASEAPLAYLEDPFAPADEHLWRDLRARLGPETCLVGDDLFATDSARVDPALADAILLKPSQAGSVSETLAAARRARAAGMALCVSHRSGETEDTFICDLAVALGARWIKTGGPRRGDRISKLNQLLRLSEDRTSAGLAAGQPRPLQTVEEA